MLRPRLLVLLLRAVLAASAAWLLVIMAMSMPGELADEALWFRVPAQIVLTFVLASVLVVVVCIWRLLTLIQRDRFFGEASRRWVDVIVCALAAGWSLFAVGAAVVVAIVYFTPELRDPGTPMLLFGMVVLSALPLLLMIVMRGLLRQASAYRAELDEVI